MLSKRLLTIANLVPKDSNVVDIGCDHGHLLIYLKDIGFNGKLLGVDNKVGPINSFKENLKKKRYEKIIKYSLSCGLEDVDSTYNTVVIAGMGFDNIKKIISEDINKLYFIDTFIVDSHTKEEETRKFFVSLGYLIEQEVILKEDGIFYEIVKFKKGHKKYSKNDFMFGPELLKERNQIFNEKWSFILNEYIGIIAKMPEKDKKYRDLESKICEIKKIII
jgi:tRNA (adenine22-N1)-methyltransferase